MSIIGDYIKKQKAGRLEKAKEIVKNKPKSDNWEELQTRLQKLNIEGD